MADEIGVANNNPMGEDEVVINLKALLSLAQKESARFDSLVEKKRLALEDKEKRLAAKDKEKRAARETEQERQTEGVAVLREIRANTTPSVPTLEGYDWSALPKKSFFLQALSVVLTLLGGVFAVATAVASHCTDDDNRVFYVIGAEVTYVVLFVIFGALIYCLMNRKNNGQNVDGQNNGQNDDEQNDDGQNDEQNNGDYQLMNEEP